MKNYRVTVILLAVLAVLVGAYFLISNLKLFETDKYIYNFNEGKNKVSISEITVSSKDRNYDFVKKGNEWTMVKPAPYKLDQDVMKSAENTLLVMSPESEVEKKPADLGKYGLDNPETKIRFKLDNGTERTLLIGSQTSVSSIYYAKDADSPVVYTITYGTVNTFTAPVSDFRDKTLLAVDINKLKSFTFFKDGAEQFKVANLEEEGKLKWKVVEPVQEDTRGDIYTSILRNIAQLKISDFIEDKASNMAQYGLDKPAYAVTLTEEGGKSQTLYYGKFDQEKQSAYIRVDNGEAVYTVGIDSFKPDTVKLGDILGLSPLSIAIGKVDKITVIDNGKTTQYLNKGDDTFTLDGKQTDKDNFTTLYVNLMALTSEGYDPSNKGGAPEVTITFDLKDNKGSAKLELVKRDDSSYFMVVDGKPMKYYLTAKKVELVRHWMGRVFGDN